MISQSTLEFIQTHLHDDPLQLLLQQNRYPDIDVPAAAQQIEGRNQAVHKWPFLENNPHYLFPPKINREQSSSETAATYKATIIQRLQTPAHDILSLADLTGGMGVDSMIMAKVVQDVDYVEQNADLVKLMQHNIDALSIRNINCHCEDSIEWIRARENIYNVLYMDPARRDGHGHKVQAFEDCTPNVLENMSQLLSHCHHLLIKASPMIDIKQALHQLERVDEVHIVSVSGECKEVLFLIHSGEDSHLKTTYEPIMFCVDIHPNHVFKNQFTTKSEGLSNPIYASSIKHYIYEPNAALMKGGAFRSICEWYGVEKLARNTHLYTSDQLFEDFPGRIFEVLNPIALTKKNIQSQYPTCHIICRNYVMSADELRKKLKVSEGNSYFIIGTRLGERPTGLVCRRFLSSLETTH